jgi:hypothetical protein
MSLPHTKSGWRITSITIHTKGKNFWWINHITRIIRQSLRIATNCGYVLKVGPLAYLDKEKYSTGPWCKEKDWVIFARYAGSRLTNRGR